jgi:hypothetical protein
MYPKININVAATTLPAFDDRLVPKSANAKMGTSKTCVYQARGLATLSWEAT